MNNAEKGVFGEKYVKQYLKSNGFVVRGRQKGEIGFDLLAERDGIRLKIEVKTSNNSRGGIPDMHNTEFYLSNGEWKLSADMLYVLRLDGDKPVQLDILTKKEVDSYSSSHKTISVIRTTKLDRDLDKRLVGTTVD